MSDKLKLTPAPARQFLTAVYGRFFSQAQGLAYLEVRGKREGEGMTFRRFYRSPEALLKDMPRWKPGLNYWVGVALRRDTKGGKKENLLALTAAFCDVDVGAAGHKGETRYQDKSEARAAIEAFSLRPSLLIDSGGGFQPYWFFREPVSLEAAGGEASPTIARMEGINRGLALALGGDVAATDAARILRLPGTFNMKLVGKPRPVGIVWCEPERVYDLAAFAGYEAGRDARPTRTPAPPGAAPGPGGEHNAYAQKALADELATLARTPEGSHNRNNQLNKSAKALGELIGAGVLDRGSVEAALYGVAVSIGLGEAEARATIKSGLDSGIKEPRALPERAGKGGGAPKQGGQGELETERFWFIGHCYYVEHRRLCLEVIDREGRPDSRPLANFQARITEEVTRDDGLKRAKEFEITGSLDTGQPLPPALIPAADFEALKWIPREWGAAAAAAPGRSLPPPPGERNQGTFPGVQAAHGLCSFGLEQDWRGLAVSTRRRRYRPGGAGGGGFGGEPGQLSFA